MAKDTRNPGDDMFQQMEDVLGTGGDMKQYEKYETFDVETKITELEEKAKALIVQICNVYIKVTDDADSEYISAISHAEKTNLVVLMKQVKYSEHIIDSLMRQLDAGGYMDPSIYETIREMQKSTISITLEISRYIRTLPEYFKFIKKEISLSKADDLHEIEIQEGRSRQDSTRKIGQAANEEEFTTSMPVRGTRELMLHIADSSKSLDNAIKNADTVVATPISVDDIDDEDEDEDDTISDEDKPYEESLEDFDIEESKDDDE